MNQFLPFNKMDERLSIEQTDSDVAMFYCLLYYAEMLTKFVVSGLLAGILDEKDRYQYSILYRLVRAEGIGDWASALDDILTGPASVNLLSDFWDEQKQLTQRLPKNTWQFESVKKLHTCFPVMGITLDRLPDKCSAKMWFTYFSEFRNKTRGHAAPKGRQCAEVCSELRTSIELITKNFTLFQRPWAYLRRNLSGKYRVTPLCGDRKVFEFLTKESSLALSDGIYLFIDKPREVALVHSDADASDFLLANGQYSNSQYEILSYISNQRAKASGDKYIIPVGELPVSETQGKGLLEPLGTVFTNLPPLPRGYVSRVDLEHKLHEQLILERHPIVTLTGAGGMGKTSLALQVLSDLAKHDKGRYDVIVWFSARDIDLLEHGPRPVRPHLITIHDFSSEYIRLLEPPESKLSGFKSIEYFSNVLSTCPIGPTLFVFDNFETVTNPSEIFRWIDTFIRTPNKILITTRIRDFSGDWPIEVTGMKDSEAYELIRYNANQLGIGSILTKEYIHELFIESSGHPYVIKILLGEVAKAKMLLKPARIVATQDEILTALFERTYATLTPAAQRIFLVLCNWRSVVPGLAIEIVLLRSEMERFDVSKALEELSKTSFIEILVSEKDNEIFISAPLAAMLFGRRKLSASPLKAAVQADTELLQTFGAASREDVRHGVLPRVKKLLKRIAERAGSNIGALDEQRSALEFIARRLPVVWIDIADLYSDLGTREGTQRAADCLRRYLEQPTGKGQEAGIVWKKLSDICRELGDYVSQIHALVEMCQVPGVPIEIISSAANVINGINLSLKMQGKTVLDSEEKKILVRKVVDVMSSRLGEMDATDLSRLAWLYLHLGEIDHALEIAERGRRLDPSNEYCQSLLTKKYIK
jgi:tetratricopeptide (TPR) repeat protein